ncbi:MAG: TonB-dependent receptor [Pseudomonadota bacterium]
MGKTSKLQFSRAALTAAVSSIAILIAAPIAAAQTLDQGAVAETPVNIPAGPLNRSILAISDTFGVDILAPNELVTGKVAPAVSGSMSAEEALDQVLSGSSLTYTSTDGAFVIIQQTAQSEPRTPIEAAKVESEERLTADTIVVVGQKLPLTPSRLPSSASIATGEDIDQPAFFDVDDYFRTAPNLTYTSRNEAPTIRGISGGGIATGAFGAISGGRPRLITYVDGVPRASSVVPNAVPLTWDISQAAFYRGAQSSVIGRNSIGGAFIIETQDPTNEFEGAVQGTFRSQDATLGGAGMINVPLIDDRLALRASVDGFDGESFVTYVGPILEAANNEIRRDEGLRARVKLAWRPFGFESDTSVRLAYERQEARITSPGDAVDIDSDNFTLTNPTAVGVADQENEFVSGELEHSFSEAWSIYSITSWQSTLEDNPVLSPGNAPFFLDVTIDTEEITHESRLNYEASVFQGVVGVFYSDRQRSELGAQGSAFPYEAEDSSSTFSLFVDTVTTVGAFELLAGLRWEQEKQDRQFSTDFGFGLDFDVDQDIPLPKAGLRWNISDDQSLTGIYFRGFSPAASAFDFFLNPGPYQFDRETSDTFELAWRSSLAGGDVVLNANVFYTTFDGQQIVDPTIQRIVNVADSEVLGAEISAQWDATDTLSLLGSIGVLDTELSDFGEGNTDLFNGNELGVAPSVTAQLRAEWQPIENLRLAGSVNFTDEYFSSFVNQTDGAVDARTLVDFQASYNFGMFDGFIFAENVFDAEYDLFRNPTLGIRNVGRPATVGLGLRAGF